MKSLRRQVLLTGCGWLILLGPFFFVTYGLVNQFTAGRSDIDSLVFSWETHIPFIPLSIIPYWSLDLLYALALFCCANLSEQRRLVMRLLLASLLACGGFLLFPMQFTFHRPEVFGVAKLLFTQLEQFDLPYNQAPSLHVILCWLLWRHFSQHSEGMLKALLSLWFLIIAVSVLTTWQHHFIDVIWGVVTGLFIDWVVPYGNVAHWRCPDKQRRELARRYCIAALLSGVAGWIYTICLWWLAAALFIVALAYSGYGAALLQKDAQGHTPLATRILLLPWRLAITFSRICCTWRKPAVSALTSDVYLGAYPKCKPQQSAVLDVTCEFERSFHTRGLEYACVPMLDLVCPRMIQLGQAVTLLEQLRLSHGSVLVHCALGLSRSAMVVAAWLLYKQPELSVSEVVNYIADRRAGVVFTAQHRQGLEQWKKRCLH